jgi:hypothetical protein
MNGPAVDTADPCAGARGSAYTALIMDSQPSSAQPWDGTVLCATCGVEHDADALPGTCAICADDRQWVPAEGQRWTTVGAQRAAGASLQPAPLEPGLWALPVRGGVGIGQHAKLLTTPEGNLMVDVPAHIDRAAVETVAGLGGLAGIIASHPHMYGVQADWSAAFGGAPVYVSEPDAGWLARRPENLEVWSGTIEPVPGVTASQPGGHFPGSVVVHYTGEDGRGVLLAGDTVGVARDRSWATFMRSFPNYLPLSGRVALRIAEHLDRYDYDRLYDNFSSSIAADARAVVHRSARRHADWAEGRNDHLT